MRLKGFLAALRDLFIKRKDKEKYEMPMELEDLIKSSRAVQFHCSQSTPYCNSVNGVIHNLVFESTY